MKRTRSFLWVQRASHSVHFDNRFITGILAVAALLGAPAGLLAQSDDFSDGNDTINPTWTHSSIALTTPTYDASAGNYRLQSGVGPFGFSYAGSFLSPIYTDFLVQMDLVEWRYGGAEVPNVMARAADINVTAGLDGYIFGYETHTMEFTIARVFNGSASDITGVGARAITLDPAKDYRFIFTGIGPILNGKAYELDASGNIVGSALVDYTVTDVHMNARADGLSGVVGYGGTPLDFSLDNFVAAVPEPSTAGLAALGGVALLTLLVLRRTR